MDILSTIQNMLAAGKDLVTNRLSAREQLIKSARSLIANLETPSETIFRMAFAEPARFALVRIAVDLKIFETLKAAQGSPVSVEDLAKPSNADPVFLHRMLRHLAAMEIIAEASVGHFHSTSFSDSLTESKYSGGIIYTHDVLGPSLHGLPEYMKKHDYQNPTNPVDGPFQLAHDTKEHFFPWIAGREAYMTAFNQYMGGYRYGKPTWLDPGLFPVEAELKLDSVAEQEGAATIVDVGGGMGQDLVELKSKHPVVTGRLVLQDLPKVIGQIDGLPAGIEKMEHDFFTPQPVKGAKVYYLHSVLHDWDDESCVKILENLKPAMRTGYSKILINDFVVPDRGATWPATAMDLGMMALGSVKERTETHWLALFKKAGLQVEKISTIEAGSESIIELTLAV
ncbi:S-adenosyl-L-methionine-dependent methyltransferase [Myriangium duriaei CBS 260.36]|uniref:S-adenosyl-L-methionine-dependent methyltransferase n=1 Tax=Myriangium duriaei CBS 260.36 TaxID=1168546 RepID=A0A9P4MJL5_9PEZI|nr:S-adenosyl-L-methionine-dependent methyltransferase [Myriangium duriaei CBS 260.36]